MKNFITLLCLIAVIGMGAIGWFMNIVKLFEADALQGMEVARAIGIFMAPIGSVLGWF